MHACVRDVAQASEWRRDVAHRGDDLGQREVVVRFAEHEGFVSHLHASMHA